MHVLINAGPTREYIDDVRYLSNASSGRMGYALAQAAHACGWVVTLVSGPVSIAPPPGITPRNVTSALEMLDACLEVLPQVDGIIAVAAVADYRPAMRRPGKLHRSAQSWQLDLVPNPDILAELCRRKTNQWAVGFAVESESLIDRAREKLASKGCDAIVANPSTTMHSLDTHVFILDRDANIALEFRGPKDTAAERIVAWINENLVRRA